MLNRVIGSKNSWKLWDHIHAFFQTHANAKLQQLRYELHATQLDQGSISEFMLKIQTIIDSLQDIGDHVSAKEHLDVILEGMFLRYVNFSVCQGITLLVR